MKAADICPVSALLPRSAFSFFVIRHWSFVIRLVLLTDHRLPITSLSDDPRLLAPKTEKPPRHSCAPAASR